MLRSHQLDACLNAAYSANRRASAHFFICFFKTNRAFPCSALTLNSVGRLRRPSERHSFSVPPSISKIPCSLSPLSFGITSITFGFFERSSLKVPSPTFFSPRRNVTRSPWKAKLPWAIHSLSKVAASALSVWHSTTFHVPSKFLSAAMVVSSPPQQAVAHRASTATGHFMSRSLNKCVPSASTIAYYG